MTEFRLSKLEAPADFYVYALKRVMEALKKSDVKDWRILLPTYTKVNTCLGWRATQKLVVSALY